VRKLRYIAPAVAATATAAAVLGPALPANASNKKSYSCNAQLCLWYSPGAGSAHFQTNAYNIANFEYYDFTNGLIVRNDAHSAADHSRGNDGAYYDYLWVYINYGAPGYYLSPYSTPGYNYANALVTGIRNNEASYYNSLY
jgi:hypothetical protein